jgi:hypothetical protein
MSTSSWCCVFCGEDDTQTKKESWCCWIFGSKRIITDKTSLTWNSESHSHTRHESVSTEYKCCVPCVVHYRKLLTERSIEQKYLYPLCCACYEENLYGFQKYTHLESPCYSFKIHATIGAAKVAPIQVKPDSVHQEGISSETIPVKPKAKYDTPESLPD